MTRKTQTTATTQQPDKPFYEVEISREMYDKLTKLQTHKAYENKTIDEIAQQVLINGIEEYEKRHGKQKA